MRIIENIISSFLAVIILSLLLCVAYPLFITAVAQTFMHHKANGSLIKSSLGKVHGSELIGQNFTSEKYFWGRPSATIPSFNSMSSSASNLGVNNPALLKNIHDYQSKFHGSLQVPIDLISSSGSGLDPHISSESAFYQVPHVARSRGMKEEHVATLVTRMLENRQLFFLGEPRINVLLLNLALDELESKKSAIR